VHLLLKRDSLLMDDDEEDFFVAPAGSPEGDEDLFVELNPHRIAPTRGVGRTGRPRAPPQSGEFGVWLVLDPATGAPGATGASTTAGLVAPRSVLGLARCSWEYKPTSPTETSVVRGPGAGLGAGDARVFGACSYSFPELFFLLEQSVEAPPTFDLDSPVSCLRLGMLWGDSPLADSGITVKEFENTSELLYTNVLVESQNTFDNAFAEALPFCLFFLCAVGSPGALV
jgi:hypothetical protein